MTTATATEKGQQMNSGGLLPKTGSLQPEWRRCGKPRCRCASGPLHGPYWYLRWREGGRLRISVIVISPIGAS